jgi:ribose transport system permease protein
MRLSRFLQSYGAVIALIVLLAINMVWQPSVFLNPGFLLVIVNQNVSVGILAVGMTLVIISGGIDLSVGSLMALVGGVGVLALNKVAGGGSEVAGCLAAVAAAVVAGTFFGFLNGLAISIGRVAPFVATLAGLAAYRSLATVLADGGEIRSASSTVFPGLASGGIPLPFIYDSNGHILVISWGIVAFIGLALLAGFLLNQTRFGRYLIAVGSNEKAAVYSAIDTGKIKLLAYTLMGALVGVAGILSAARVNSVSTSQAGLYYELDAIAAVVIGGTSLSGGKGRIWTTVVGVLLLGLIGNMLVTIGVSTYWQGAVKGVIILLAVLIQRGRAE